jgi:hypothetical protein
VRYDTAGRGRSAQHGDDTSNPKKVVTMRPVRILLAAVALIAVGLTGWALTTGDGYTRPGAEPAVADPAVTQAPPQAEPAAPADPAPQGQTGSGGDPPSATTQPAPRPRILGFGSEPVFGSDGGFWQLPAGSGEAILITDAQHATRVEFLLTPTGTGVGGQAVSLGVDTNGRDAYTARWKYADQPLLAHLTVRATGPGGTTEKVVGVYHPDPVQQP